MRKSEKVSVDEASLGIRLFLTKLPQANLSNYRNANIIISKKYVSKLNKKKEIFTSTQGSAVSSILFKIRFAELMHALVVHVVIGLFDTKTPKTMTAIKRPTETVLTATIILAEELFCKINNCLFN